MTCVLGQQTHTHTHTHTHIQTPSTKKYKKTQKKRKKKAQKKHMCNVFFFYVITHENKQTKKEIKKNTYTLTTHTQKKSQKHD